MPSNDLAAMMMEAAGLLNAKVLDSSLTTCQLDMDGTRIKLAVLDGPSGCHIGGKIELAPLAVEESGQEVLYAMYMNSTLYESFGLPLWFGMDAEENRLVACFSLSTFELTPSRLAETLKPLQELSSFDLSA